MTRILVILGEVYKEKKIKDQAVYEKTKLKFLNDNKINISRLQSS